MNVKKKVDDLENMLEKWCYYFKHAEDITPEELEKLIQDKIIKEALEAVDQFYWTEAELDSYEAELKRVWDNQAAEAAKFGPIKKELAQAKQQAEQAKKEGREEGREEEKIARAQNSLSLGLPIETIVKLTGLSQEKIEALKSRS
jgi:predicted transposase/invertase (TIGR01784 family)